MANWTPTPQVGRLVINLATIVTSHGRESSPLRQTFEICGMLAYPDRGGMLAGLSRQKETDNWCIWRKNMSWWLLGSQWRHQRLLNWNILFPEHAWTPDLQKICRDFIPSGIILGMGSANERRRYLVTPPLIGWVHSQNDKVPGQ